MVRGTICAIRETVKALAEDGCRSLKFQRAMPQGEWRHQESHYLSAAETSQAYLDYLPLYLEDGCPLNIQMEGYFAYDRGRGYSILCDKHMDADKMEKHYPCGVVHRSLYVGPNGAVTPCMSMCGAEIESRFPNIFQTPLTEILSDSSCTRLTEKKISYILNHVDECRECPYRYRCCGGCRAQATGQSCGDCFAKDPVICEMFKGGWVDKAIQKCS